MNRPIALFGMIALSGGRSRYTAKARHCYAAQLRKGARALSRLALIPFALADKGGERSAVTGSSGASRLRAWGPDSFSRLNKQTKLRI